EWTVEKIQAAGTGEFPLRLSYFQRLFLTGLAGARGAVVSLGNAPGKGADLKIGMRLGLLLAAVPLAVSEVLSFTPERPQHFLTKEVDVAKKTLSVTRAGKEFATSLFVGDAEILLEGNDEVELKDLKPGMQVSLSFVATGGRLSLRRIQTRK